MSIEYQVLTTLLDEFIKRINAARGDNKECQRLSLSLQRSMGMSARDVAGLVQKAYGYIEKSAKDDPPPGPMERLPLANALERVSVAVVRGDALGFTLQCLRCGAQWSPSFRGGDRARPEKKFWRCPQGCNASSRFLWDENQPPTYNPMFDYRRL